MTIDELMKTPRGSSMLREEFLHISQFLGNKNFLVFGTGYDTEYWRTVNSNGFTVFLEHNKTWMPENSDNVYLIKYTRKIREFGTMMKEYRNGIYDKFIIDCPDIIRNTQWDVILVDAPQGFGDDNPGRSQSIFLAKEVSNENTIIFVHDAERRVEDTCSKEMFSEIVEDLVFPPRPGYNRKLRQVKI